MNKKILILISFLIGFLFTFSLMAKEKWVPLYERQQLGADIANAKKKLTDKKEKRPAIKVKKVSARSTQKGQKFKAQKLLELYSANNQSKMAQKLLKQETYRYGAKSVPVLIEVMKKDKYPEKNRWMATLLLGQLLGQRSSPFLAKFLEHPHWMMRLASLKTLYMLKDKRYAKKYAGKLSDPSLFVRMQALENIKGLQLKKYSPRIFQMMFEDHNYSGVKGGRKRLPIIKNVIRALGDLGYTSIKPVLLKMIREKKYNDLFHDLNQSLSKLSQVKVPRGSKKSIRKFWIESNI